MSNKVEHLLKFFKKHPEEIPHCGIYNCSDICGDPKKRIYNKDGVRVLACHYYDYIEIFGLTEEEFKEVKDKIEDIAYSNDDSED